MLPAGGQSEIARMYSTNPLGRTFMHYRFRAALYTAVYPCSTVQPEALARELATLRTPPTYRYETPFGLPVFKVPTLPTLEKPDGENAALLAPRRASSLATRW